MSCDLMFLAKNRKRFVEESLGALRRNTNWPLVDHFVIYDDGSTDGTLEFFAVQAAEMGAELRQTSVGSAVAAQNHFVQRSTADFVAKCDCDAMYPPDWLDIALGVLNRNPDLQVLCLEDRGISGNLPHGYQATVEGDGLFVARTEIFRGVPLPPVIRKYWGWETWMRQHHIKAGWLVPSIPVFLLDRLPFEPWLSLSNKYEANGWQRPVIGAVRRYSMAQARLWAWCDWPEPEVKVYRATRPLRVNGAVLAPGDAVPGSWQMPLISDLERRGEIRAWLEPANYARAVAQ